MGFLIKFIKMVFFFFHNNRVTSFISLKAFSLWRSVQREGEEKMEKTERLEGFKSCSRCGCPRKGAPINVWKEEYCL